MAVDEAVIEWGRRKLPERLRNDPTLHLEEVTFGVTYADYGDSCYAAIYIVGHFDQLVQKGRKPRNKPPIMAPERFNFEHVVEEPINPADLYREIDAILREQPHGEVIPGSGQALDPWKEGTNEETIT